MLHPQRSIRAAMRLQDALIAERTLEGGSPYEMSLDDADIYRQLPFTALSREDQGHSYADSGL